MSERAPGTCRRRYLNARLGSQVTISGKIVITTAKAHMIRK
jgi:hypothetical protein